MSVSVIVVCALLFVFSILEAFVFGEKYAKWWFRQWSKDYKDYDLKKFRIIRATTLGIVFVLSFMMGFSEFRYLGLLLPIALIVIILHYIIILHFCKKADNNKQSDNQ